MRPTPPRWAEFLIGRFVPERFRDDHLGDLREGFDRLAHDPGAARRWYLRQLRRSVLPGLRMHFRSFRDHRPTSGNTMESLKQDLVYGLRSLRKNPLFATVATLTLALAIGVNSAIFSLVELIVFADLPMQEAETVQIVRGVNPEQGVSQGSVSMADFLDLQERSRSFESLAALTETSWVMTGADQPQRVQGAVVTANQLQTWKLPPVLGRDFAPGEDQPGAAPVTLLAYSFWQSQFGGDPGVLGETLRLDGTEYTIIGVMNEKMEFASFRTLDVWVPLEVTRDGAARDQKLYFVTGRLAEGVTHAQATEEARSIGQALADEYPAANAGWGLSAAPVMESLIDDSGKTILLLLVLTVTFVILIACANIANMLLARSTARARELSVRAALGAGRLRIVRQLMTESLVISLVAAALGLAFAGGLLEALVRISNGAEVLFLMAELNGRVIAFTVLLAFVAPLAFGLFPALRATAGSTSGVLRESRGADGGRRGKRARSVLVGAQVSLALTLMIVAGLLSRSVYNQVQRDVGFEVEGLVAMEVTLPESGYPDIESRRLFFDQLVEQTAALPAVQSASMLNVIPGAEFGSRMGIEIEGRPVAEGQARAPVYLNRYDAGAFEVLGLPLLSGRYFDAQDGPESLPVVILSRRVAEAHWPGEDPIGRRIRTGTTEDDWMQVVGVVEDVVSARDDEPASANIYVPVAQDLRRRQYVAVRADADIDRLAGALRSAVWALDANQPIDRVITFEQAIYDNHASTYALITLFITFALFALVMAAIGIYGVMSYMVSQRTAEIGLRMALGAEAGSVRLMVIRQGSRVLLLGVGFGLLLSFGLSQMLSGLVYGISTTDAVTFIGVPLVLALVAMAANWIPAARATRTDPVEALRAE